jgi:hypothetical protein
MFLVCDKTRSKRAEDLREKILRAGYPCACCKISEIGNYLPVLRIISYTEMLDFIRSTPYDHVRAMVIGEGFVNSALNAEQINSEEEVLPSVKQIVLDYYHVQPEWILQYGMFCDDGVFLAEDFFEIFGNIIVPTEREYLIFKYLQMTSGLCEYVSAYQICRFCYRASKIPKNEEEAAKNLAVHIANLNHKSQKAMGCRIIEARRFIGYRFRKDI